MALTNSERAQVREALAIVERETANPGDKLILKGFGTFQRKAVAEKKARNPQTQEVVTVPAHSVLKFKASKSTSAE